jgi:hypothetical protein
MRSPILLAIAVALAALAVPRQTPPVARTAGDRADAAVLRFRIADDSGAAIPGRLTFLGADGPEAKLFPNAAAAPDDLAVRGNAIASLSGQGAITVPPGRYTVHASRGLEWSVDAQELALEAGKEAEATFRLRHEVDTAGRVSGDFHLHTLTHSGHGDSNLKERIITLVAEGVEFAVATDHNHNTDYGPTIKELDAGARMTAVTGNEVTTSIGHFNAFPLDPARPVPNHRLKDTAALFRLIRGETNAFGVIPVIQLNHPRTADMDYLGIAGLDAVTGESASPLWSADFDTLEVFNENEGWGYEDPSVPSGDTLRSQKHSVLRDWFHLLNRGFRFAAVGNSDSHHVLYQLAGYPRNFVPGGTDDPARIDPRAVADGLRRGDAFTTIGPFVEWSVNGQPMGSTVRAPGGRVELRVRVQAASWIDCDRVLVVVNGDVTDVLSVPQARTPVRLDVRHPLRVERDSWIALLVEGDEPLAPVVPGFQRPVRPRAVTNPVRVTLGPEGRWTPPSDRARELARAGDEGRLLREGWEAVGPSERALVLKAMTEAKAPCAAAFARRGLRDGAREVRLMAARVAERLAAAELGPALAAAEATAALDPYLQLALLRARRACGKLDAPEAALAYAERHGADVVRRYGPEVVGLVPEARAVRDWEVAGFERRPEGNAPREAVPAPEREGAKLAWRPATAGDNGVLDLAKLAEGSANGLVAWARTHLQASAPRVVGCALGADDRCRVWLNGELVHEDRGRGRADAWRNLLRLRLRAGWNRLLVEVENGRGAFVLTVRLFDPEIPVSARPAAEAPAER